MYPFPPKEEISFLIGETLSQIRINPFSIDLVFERNSVLTAEFAIEHRPAIGEQTRYDLQKMVHAPPITFHHCIGRKIVDLAVADTRLQLKFDGGDVVWVYSHLGQHESGQIARGRPDDKDAAYFVF